MRACLHVRIIQHGPLKEFVKILDELYLFLFYLPVSAHQPVFKVQWHEIFCHCDLAVSGAFTVAMYLLKSFRPLQRFQGCLFASDNVYLMPTWTVSFHKLQRGNAIRASSCKTPVFSPVTPDGQNPFICLIVGQKAQKQKQKQQRAKKTPWNLFFFYSSVKHQRMSFCWS